MPNRNYNKSVPSKDWFFSDRYFDQVYSGRMQELALRHWTPLAVARKAAGFLAVEPAARVLDIGSGIGKFCLAAAHYRPDAFFTGIEQREHLVEEARNAQEILNLSNASFVHGNFTQINFSDFNHFYFYNAFYENLVDTDRIDHSIDYSVELFNYYTRYLHRQLDLMPAGTRLATFHGMDDEVPPSYHIVWSGMDHLLKCWIKI